MYFIDWNAVATDEILDELRSIAGSGSKPNNEELRPVVADILRSTGGLPITESDWSNAECTLACRKLLHEATGHVLRGRRKERPVLPGCDLGTGSAELDKVIVAASRVYANAATTDDLEPLPVLGEKTSLRTVNDRRQSGTFRSAHDLAERVAYVGTDDAQRMAMRLDFGPLSNRPKAPSDFGTDFTRLLSDVAGTDEVKRLTRCLEYLAASTAETPHPFTVARRARTDLPGPKATQSAKLQTDSVELLEDDRYFERVKTLINGAKQRVDVAMFFISMTSRDHPSMELLERLADAAGSGKDVRVLLDLDRDDDPYGSRIINKPAFDYLKNKSVSVRFDKKDNLLHSKFVVIDDDTSIIGSHNWTAGSYFRYDDTSVAVKSQPLVSKLSERFDALWTDAEQGS